MSDKIYRTQAAAERIGISASTMEKWRSAGIGPPFVRIGRRAIGYKESALDAFLGAELTSTRPAESPPTANGATDDSAPRPGRRCAVRS
jgi:predicted DNA-binding transcriptional regulator AlpA